MTYKLHNNVTLLTLFTPAITNSKNDSMVERAYLSPSTGDRSGNHVFSPLPHNLPNKNDDVNRGMQNPYKNLKGMDLFITIS
jgi:hypothetical protein